jgi:superfamily I DNA and/or RNA helicase
MVRFWSTDFILFSDLFSNVRRLRKVDGLDVLTIDKYQGRDKACIIISLVRSNERKAVWHRVVFHR